MIRNRPRTALRRAARHAFGVAAALALCVHPAHAQLAPDERWLTLVTPNFRVTFTPDLELPARRAGAFAELAHARLRQELGHAPRGRIDIVVADNVDITNGLASVYPGNRIVVYPIPPVGSLGGLEQNRDWLELVVVHELAHIFHHDRAAGIGRPLRAVFGRVPYGWPFFPAQMTPVWNIEGLATWFESRFTGAGRVEASYHPMVLRTAALAGELEPIDRASGTGPSWPAGSRAYIYGSMFDEWLAQRYGADVHERLTSATARALVPPFLDFDRIAKRALGRSFTDLWQEWQREVGAAALATADSVAAAGLTPRQELTNAGYHAYFPRVSPDGRLVAFAAQPGDETAATYLVAADGSHERRLARRNQGGGTLGPAAWLPDGSALITAQFEVRDPYRTFLDLYRVDVDGNEERLTRGARVGEPDVAPDGRIVAVQNGRGTNRLVVLEHGAVRALTDFEPDVHWASPRWSPDGTRIAASRWTRGGDHDLVLLDSAGSLLRQLTHDAAVDGAPAWSPDGRYLYFHSDRGGIPNIFVADVEHASLRQVTNVASGAFQPDVSADGRWLFFAGYHADGFRIERTPLDSATWRAAPRSSPAGAHPFPPDTAGGQVRGYSPWRTLAPRFWLPIYVKEVDSGVDVGEFFGAFTAGTDLVERHSYAASLEFDPSRDRLQGSLSYDYRGLGNPVLSLRANRDWDFLGNIRVSPDSLVPVFAREDVVSATALLQHVRFRYRGFFGAGVEQVYERRYAELGPALRLRNPHDELVGVLLRAGVSTVRASSFAISREDGASLSAVARQRWDRDVTVSDEFRFDAGYREAYGVAAAYKSVPLGAFARHVLAARASALWRDGPGAGLSSIGGASGSAETTAFGVYGGSTLLLPVRGFNSGVRRGTRAWTASLEARAPVALVERGYRLLPAFLDRVAASAFLDAGNAWCDDPARSSACLGQRGDDAGAAPTPVVGGGVELGVDATLFYRATLFARFGAGFPLVGPSGNPVLYFRLGQAF